MPLYEYECENCHEIFELFQGWNDPPVAKCQECSGAARRIISRPAILFKGSGFHVTDYHRSGNGREAPDANGKSQKSKEKKSSPPATGEKSGPAESPKKE